MSQKVVYRKKGETST
jgi:hypothetical protein